MENNVDYNLIIHELNSIKRALGLQAFTDDISVYGRLSRVEVNSVKNLQRLQNNIYIMDGNSDKLQLTSSDNPIFINGQMITSIDYNIIDGTTISFNEILPAGTEIIELVGSFVQQNKLEFQYTTLDGTQDIIEVTDTLNAIFINGINIPPSEYTVISSYQIQFNTVYPENTLVGELLGGGRNGTDGYIPVKGIDYFDGKDGPSYKGNWNSTDVYPISSLVRHNYKMWISIVSSENHEPGLTGDWEVFVESGTMKYLEGDDFPIADSSNIGSFFQKISGGLYVCTNEDNPSWKQIGV